MRILINPNQLSLLTSNYHIVEGQGLVQNEKKLMLEGRIPEYKVSLWISSYPAEIRIGTNGGGSMAMIIARKLFPHARIISVRPA